MTRSFIRIAGLAIACLSIMALALAARPADASAEETVWACKPGQSDDLCAGTIAGKTMPVPSQALTYSRPANPGVDCFYLYPTQSGQSTPNSNLEKDPEIRRTVVQQARMFSTTCRVFAPMYRQVTYSGNQSHGSPDVEVAYESAKAGFLDYLRNYNNGRGFIMIGHSQGSAHTARLIDELVDTDASLRRRFVGAIAPGANIHVPIGENIGGMYENVPACSKPGQFGCLVAYSMYNGYPGNTPQFANVASGYWIYPEDRPDPASYEVVCTDPSILSGNPGKLAPLINSDYLLSTPDTETPAPWREFPDQVEAECARENGSHWLDVSITANADPILVTMIPAVTGGTNNYHVPEVNLAEADLLKIAASQTQAYLKKQARRNRLVKQRNQLQKRLKNQKRRAAKAAKKCRKAKPRTNLKKRSCRKASKQRRQVKKTKRKLTQVKKQIRQINRI